jgi:hypothetical protein
MDQTEVKKTCGSCGKDLIHKKRHKHRDGTYTCPQCAKAHDRWPRRALGELTKGKSLRIIFYIVLAAIACAVFWTILDTMSQAGSVDD